MASERGGGNHRRAHNIKGDVLKRRLEELGITQSELFEKIGILEDDEFRIRLGYPVHLAILRKIAKAIGLPVDQLMDPLPGDGGGKLGQPGGMGSVELGPRDDDDSHTTYKIAGHFSPAVRERLREEMLAVSAPAAIGRDDPGTADLESLGQAHGLEGVYTKLLVTYAAKAFRKEPPVSEDDARSRAIALIDFIKNFRDYHIETYVKRTGLRLRLEPGKGRFDQVHEFVVASFKDYLKVNRLPEAPKRPIESTPEKMPDADARYADVVGSVTERSRAFREQIAAELAPALNAEIGTMPHETLEQKKALADWVNGQLEPLGLAVKCPKTGQPAKLKGDVGDWPGVGRFQFQIHEGSKRVRTLTANELPELQIIDAMPARETQVDWQSKVQDSSRRPGRRL